MKKSIAKKERHHTMITLLTLHDKNNILLINFRFIFFKILKIENLKFFSFLKIFRIKQPFGFLFVGNFQRTSGFHEIIGKEIGGLG
jgi:hypothetical protein